MSFYLTDQEVNELLFYSGVSKIKRHRPLDSLGSSYATGLRQNAHSILMHWSDHGVPNNIWKEIERNSPLILKKFNLIQTSITVQPIPVVQQIIMDETQSRVITRNLKLFIYKRYPYFTLIFSWMISRIRIFQLHKLMKWWLIMMTILLTTK